MTDRHEGAVDAPRATGWRVFGYRVTGRIGSLARRAANFVDHCMEGINLGLLRPGDVEQIVFDSYAGQPDFYDPDDYQPPFASEEQALARDLREIARGKRLLDAFCGQGREARAFAAVGFDVVGIDRLPVMIESATDYAEREGFDATFTVADFDAYKPESPFDVVYTSTWMYSTVQTRQRRQQFLRQCKALCATDGLVVISYKIQSPKHRVRYRVKHVLARLTSLLTMGNRSVELGDRLYYGLFWHHFDETALEEELHESGLTPLSRREVSDKGELVFRVLGMATAGTSDTAGSGGK